MNITNRAMRVTNCAMRVMNCTPRVHREMLYVIMPVVLYVLGEQAWLGYNWHVYNVPQVLDRENWL